MPYGYCHMAGEGFAEGGVVLCWRSSPTLIGNIIRENAAYQSSPSCPGFQPLAYGGGVACLEASPTLIGNVIAANQALTFTNCDFGISGGGGISCRKNSAPLIANSLIVSNAAVVWDGAAFGGGVYVHDSTPWISSSTIADNFVEVAGYFVAAGAGLAVLSGPGPLAVTNSIFWGNAADSIYPAGLSMVEFCDVEYGYAGLGNLNVDPLFLGEGQYRLQAGSPLLDQGNDLLVPLDVADLDHDHITNEPLPRDLQNLSRFFDSPGGGAFGIIDLGAYENH